jgi:hypothetical protein
MDLAECGETLRSRSSLNFRCREATVRAGYRYPDDTFCDYHRIGKWLSGPICTTSTVYRRR